MDDKLIDLEMKISYQEDLIQELNRIVANQEKRISRQEQRNDILAEKVKEMADFLEEDPVSQKPPHY